MNPFDLHVFHWINGFAAHPSPLNDVMKFFAHYALEIYAILFIIAWFALPRQETERRHALVVSVLSGVLALLVNVVIGAIWYRPRPFVQLPKGTYTQLLPHPADASFPSDHVSGSFGFAGALWHRADRWVQIVFTVVAVLVMIARVYVGVHWPTDVLGGMVVGILSSLVLWRFEKWLRPLTNLLLRIFRMGKYAGGARH